MNEFKNNNLDPYQPTENTRTVIDSYLTNFKGGNRVQRGGGWSLKGGGNNTVNLGSTTYGTLLPSADNTYSLGSASFRWTDIRTVTINGVTPNSGTVTYYVASSSGGPVTTAVTFSKGILT